MKKDAEPPPKWAIEPAGILKGHEGAGETAGVRWPAALFCVLFACYTDHVTKYSQYGESLGRHAAHSWPLAARTGR